jgi:transposase
VLIQKLEIREVSYYSIVNGIFYQLKKGCTWRVLPKWQAVCDYFNFGGKSRKMGSYVFSRQVKGGGVSNTG